jgi:arylsulfatase A-like enzyme
MDRRARVLLGRVALPAVLIVTVLMLPSTLAQGVGQGVAGLEPDWGHSSPIKHVLLISVDGLHQSDLEWYVQTYPNSELAMLVQGGMEYSNAHTPVPSDSYPTTVALMTGGNPAVTGIYYDDAFDHDVDAAGTTTCTGAPTGANVTYDSPDDLNSSRLDAGQGIPGLLQNPALIMDMTGNPKTVLNDSTFPVNPVTCQPIQPYSFLEVNTIFNVAQSAGLRTAWADKHPVYDVLDGPSGNGIDDLFTPEIDSNAIEPNGQPYPVAPDGANSWTDDNAATKQYDSYKVQAVINEIDGYDHSGRYKVGVPAIFGMNFQTVSTAQKLYESPAVLMGPNAQGNYTLGPVLLGGYKPGTDIPGPLLQSALNYVNAQMGRIVNAIQQQGLSGSTAIILTAKHGQSPLNPDQLRLINSNAIIYAVNAAWSQSIGCKTDCSPLIVGGTDDDVWQSYLSVKTQTAANFVEDYLWNHSVPGVTYANTTVSVPHSGLAQIWAGKQAAQYFGVPFSNPRYPDVFGRVQIGVIYTTPPTLTPENYEIAEHGGGNPGDRDVPILVYAPWHVRPGSNGQWVETTQVAPTILKLLGLNPDDLKAVQIEHTQVLPGLGHHHHHWGHSPDWGTDPVGPQTGARLESFV